MERSISGSSNGNSLKQRFQLQSILNSHYNSFSWPFSVTVVYLILTIIFYFIRLQLTTIMVWSLTRVMNHPFMLVLCAVFLPQNNFCQRARRHVWAFPLQLLWPGWVWLVLHVMTRSLSIALLLSLQKLFLFLCSILFCFLFLARAPPLWGSMKLLHQKIPEVALRKSQMYGYLLEQEK